MEDNTNTPAEEVIAADAPVADAPVADAAPVVSEEVVAPEAKPENVNVSGGAAPVLDKGVNITA